MRALREGCAVLAGPQNKTKSHFSPRLFFRARAHKRVFVALIEISIQLFHLLALQPLVPGKEFAPRLYLGSEAIKLSGLFQLYLYQT